MIDSILIGYWTCYYDIVIVYFYSSYSRKQFTDTLSVSLFFLISLVCISLGNVAVESTMLDVHEVAVETYPLFDRDYKTQQQILWMFGTVLKWPRARDRIHVSESCMNFFKSLFETRELLIRTVFKGVTMKVHSAISTRHYAYYACS